MSVFVPQEKFKKLDYPGGCYQSCYSLLDAVAALTGLSFALFSTRKEQFSQAFNINEFCSHVLNGEAPEHIKIQCNLFHQDLFKKAARSGHLEVGECEFHLKSFVLPLKSKKDKTLFYIVGGHFFSEPPGDIPPELIKDSLLDSQKIREIYRKIPVIDDEKFQVIIEKLSGISDLYSLEMKREGQDLKLSRVVHFVSKITHQLTGEINLKELLLKICDEVSHAFEVNKCAITIWDTHKQFVEVFASNNQYADELFKERIEPARGATGVVAYSGETFYSYDAQNDKRLYPVQIQNWEIKSLLSVPLKVGDSIIGCMHLVAQEERKMFLKKEVEYAEALASEIALVVEIGRLYNISQKKATDLAKSREELKSYFKSLGTALSTALDLKQLLKIVVEISVRLTRSQAGSILLIEDKKLAKYIAVAYEEDIEKTVSEGRKRDGESYESGEIQPSVIVEGMAAATSEKFLEEKFAPGEILSYLGIPLVRKGEIKGLLNIMDNRKREFTPEEVEMLMLFGDHAALAIDNVRLFRSEQKKAREATTLYQAAKSINQSMELGEVLSQSADQLTQLVGVDRCLIMLLDFKKLDLYIAASRGLSEEQRNFFELYRIPVDEISDELWGDLIMGKPAFLDSAPGDLKGLQRFFKIFPTNSCLLVPLITKEQLVGIIYLDDSKISRIFRQSEIRLVMTLAIQIASAIQRATLMEQLEGNLNQLKALHQVSTAVTGTLSLPKVFDLIVDKASHLIKAPAAAILTLDENTREYLLNASRGLSGEIETQEVQQAISLKTAKRKSYLTYYVSADLDGDDPKIHRALESASMGGYVSVPLIARKRVVGVLNCFCSQNDKFDPQEIRLLRSFANQAAIAVENARLYLIIKNKVKELATVFEVGKSITSTLELDRVLAEVASSVREVMKADAVMIMNLNEANQVLTVIRSEGFNRLPGGYTIRVGAGIAGIAAKVGRPMILHDDDIQSSPYKFPEHVRDEGLKTVLSVPMKVRDRIIGLINIYKKMIFHYSPTEINLLSTLANSAAIAIENARLYNEQYDIAQIIRRNLMPQKEMSYKNIDVGYVYIPSELLSGDYFEVITLSESRYGLVISDVSGKGTQAAIYNARAKYILKSYAMADYSPSGILTLLNMIIEEEAAQEKFISLLYVDLDVEANEIIVSSAGHEPLIVWDDSEKEAIIIDEPKDLPIGILPDSTYTEKIYRIGKGDILVLYTDGITEARSREGEFFGTERILEIIESSFHLNAQTLASKIYTTVQKFTRRKITDDFSLLVVKV